MVYINSIILLHIHSLADVLFLMHRKLKGKFNCDWDNWKENFIFDRNLWRYFFSGFFIDNTIYFATNRNKNSAKNISVVACFDFPMVFL